MQGGALCGADAVVSCSFILALVPQGWVLQLCSFLHGLVLDPVDTKPKDASEEVVSAQGTSSWVCRSVPGLPDSNVRQALCD